MPLTIIDQEERIPVQIGDATIHCRRMPDEISREIDRRYRIRRKDAQGRVYFEIDPDRTEERATEVWDYVIIRWDNVVHPVTGAPVPCDAAHKTRLHGDIYDRITEALKQGATPPDPTPDSAPRSNGSSSSRSGSVTNA